MSESNEQARKRRMPMTFQRFCALLNVTAPERKLLVHHLAHFRYMKTLEILEK